MDAVRLQYLDAMGVTVWVRRTSDPAGTRAALEAGDVEPGGALLYVGPGTGSSLCIGADEEVPGSILASDIVRALGKPAIWAWPADNDRGVSLGDAIADRAISRILIFGEETAERLFGSSPPESLGNIQVIRLPDLDELAGSASLRKSCWKTICRAGIVKAS